VGFRPFVYRLAVRHGLRGWVKNCVGEVEIHAEGAGPALDAFARALIDEAPPLARPRIDSIEHAPTAGGEHFVIAPSDADAPASIHVPPDYFTCDDCLEELQDPADRRHAYPFINCTQCGPRYTLIAALPYDRPNTSMAAFPLCPACLQEYEDPTDRRFHAEPVACPVCGPTLRFVRDGVAEHDGNRALALARAALDRGDIVAVKGIGGYHLMCDAARPDAVARLRRRKPRPDKPLALMLGDESLWGDTDTALVRGTPEELALLASPARPIVLMRAADTGRAGAALRQWIAPGLDELGVMRPYSPLHHLLLQDRPDALVATSANISGEPVLTDETEVETRLAHLADAFLHHNRPILRPADDPVYRSLAGRPRPLRLGRGIAPLELTLPRPVERPLLAVGGHMKNAIALAWDDRLVLSPHIGDMGTARSLDVFETVVADLQRLYDVRAAAVVCDAHPDYTTSRWARSCGLPVTPVLHHHAHASLAVRTGRPDEDAIVFAWDGVGLGDDGSLWGGEALVGGPGHWHRAATMRPFRLPGGDRAGREPWRSAAGLCWTAGRDWAGLPADGDLARAAWERGLNAPVTTAVGRLFDGAAALLGLAVGASYEGQGPMQLEAVAARYAAAGKRGDAPRVGPDERLPLAEDPDGLLISDWAPLLAMLTDATRPAPERAWRFQEAMALALLDQALALRERSGVGIVGLGGGCFQNRFLTDRVSTLLADAGFEVLIDPAVPLNDGGLAAGQLIEAAGLTTAPASGTTPSG
jgi:hydrogenase maturation protein HypF